MIDDEQEMTQQEIDAKGEAEDSNPRRNHGFRSDYTVGDLAEHDKDMYLHAVRNHKIRAFHNQKQAWSYVGSAFERILRKVGVTIRGKGGRNIDKQLKRERVIVEDRKYKSDDPVGYKTGKYIYKNNELAGFVSHPYRKESRIISNEPKIVVETGGL